jgi:cell division protein FtsZ
MPQTYAQPQAYAQEPRPAPQQQAAPAMQHPTQAAPQASYTQQARTASTSTGDVRMTQLTPAAPQAAATPAAQQQQGRISRSGSLFTRITGFGINRPSTEQQAQAEDVEENFEAEEAGQQQRLGIDPTDRPRLSQEQPEDLLDIPAFLRRQTNH